VEEGQGYLFGKAGRCEATRGLTSSIPSAAHLARKSDLTQQADVPANLDDAALRMVRRIVRLVT